MTLTKHMWRFAGGAAMAALLATSGAQAGGVPKTMIWTS